MTRPRIQVWKSSWCQTIVFTPTTSRPMKIRKLMHPEARWQAMIEDPAKPEEDNSAILLLRISLFHFKILTFFCFFRPTLRLVHKNQVWKFSTVHCINSSTNQKWHVVLFISCSLSNFNFCSFRPTTINSSANQVLKFSCMVKDLFCLFLERFAWLKLSRHSASSIPPRQIPMSGRKKDYVPFIIYMFISLSLPISPLAPP